MVDVRKEDKTIRPFSIPSQSELVGDILKITTFNVIKNHKPVTRKSEITLKKKNTRSSFRAKWNWEKYAS
jgi:hypothetical protein